jgi:hypothetical protein
MVLCLLVELVVILSLFTTKIYPNKVHLTFPNLRTQLIT